MTAVVVTSERSQSPARFPWGISKLGLLIMVCAQFLVGLDAAIATIAMPTMERELSVNAASIQWTVIGYMVACAAVAVPVGALGDRIGKRPVYVAGLGAVLAGSIICTLSGSNWVLVTGRAIGGCGAAATTVMTLAILTSAVSADLVPKVVGMWAALSSSATCLAPMLSGLLVQTVGWRLMFGIDVIPLIVIMILARWTVPNTERATATRMGGLGLGLMVASVLLVAGGLSRSGGNRLLSAGVLLPVVAGLLVMVAFVYQQRRTAKPLTDWKVIGQYPIPAVLVLLAALGLALTGSMFQEMMLLQKAFDYSPLLAGSLDVGPAVIFVVCAALTSRISARFGVART
ncbi:MAG: MFS transporter, partial [Actinomycetes bacterium]